MVELFGARLDELYMAWSRWI